MVETTTDPNWIARLAQNAAEQFRDRPFRDEITQLTADVATTLKDLLPAEITTVEAATTPAFLYADDDDISQAACVETRSIGVSDGTDRKALVVELATKLSQLVIASKGTKFFPYILLIPIPMNTSGVHGYHTRFATR